MNYMGFRVNQYSEKEIREFIEKNFEQLNENFWYLISSYQTLSEDFIREFQDQVTWHRISVDQKLSEEFLIEFIERVEIWWLSCNLKIAEEVRNRIKNLKKVIDQ